MFWGLIMEPQKRYTQTVKRSFHVSMAALDIGSACNEPTQVICAFEERNYLLCTLKSQNVLQVPLDLNFEVGDQVSFATNGKSHVHLTGYLVEDDLDESSKFDEESNDAEGVTRKRMQLDNDASPPKKKSKTLELLEAVKTDEDDSDDSDFEISDMDDANLTVLEEQEEEEDDEDEVEEEGSDENEEEQSDSDNVEEEEDSSEGDDDDDEEEEVSLKENGMPLIKARKQTEAPKPKKQDKQSQKVANDGLKTKAAKSPTKGDKTPGKGDKSPTKGDKSPVAVPKRTVEGGVIIEDIKLGNGQVAKNGKLVQVYYEGRLKNNNKMFDSTMKGPGFRFRLGKQEVIRGWDVGVLGMKVGGKRRIVCPPTMAYGQKGSPPVIPPNSTLVFDIELKNLN